MELENVLTLCAGLALFLYGMHMMSHGLELAAGNRMQQILEKLTSNRFIGVLVGASITALIQSSSATTVMVVGFVNSGIMTLNQAVWVIMGANIGTTITGQLIALDIGRIAPILAITGVIFAVFIKNKKINCWGEILAGLGILFIGMNLMSDAMAPLRENQTFIDLMTNFNNPIIAILVGAGFTAIIQSSSASIGILQTLANGGLISLGQSVFILLGQNIGTCITAFLASLSSNRNAKRTTIIHLLFNIIGTIMFLGIIGVIPLVDWVESWTPLAPAAQIANFHTLFNIITTIILLPFGLKLAKLSTVILPIKESEKDNVKTIAFLSENFESTSAVVSGINSESRRMFEMASENVSKSLSLLNFYDQKSYNKILSQEEYISYISNYITNYVGKTELSDSKLINTIFRMTTTIEKVSNHAFSIANSANELAGKKDKLIKENIEIEDLKLVLLEYVNYIKDINLSTSEEVYHCIKESKAKLDNLTSLYRENEMVRVHKKESTIENCVIYSKILINVERISYYLLEVSDLYREYSLAIETME
jgi:Na/Pi-cotransporter